MNGNVIDFSKADIYELKNTEMSKELFERVLFAQNEFSLEKFALRHKQMRALDAIEDMILRKEEKLRAQEEIVRDRQ